MSQSQVFAGERGSGSLLAIAVLAATLTVAGLAVPLYAINVLRQASVLAADAAALAAADALSGAVTGYPCERAEQVAQLNGASLVDCQLDGMIATLTVQRPYLGFQVSARSRAGPPEFHPSSIHPSSRSP